MSKASGILLITLGVGVAAYAMPSHNDEGEQGAAQEISVAKADLSPANVGSSTATKVTTDKAAPLDIVPPIPKPAVRPAKDAATFVDPRSQVATPARANLVATAPRIYGVGAPSEPKVVAGVIPGDRVGLTRELQRELRRVGCYDGEVNGTWTPASRRAMKVFTDRVNASLPVDQPDYILLKLVQGSAERICGAGCSAGQAMAGDGRCLPHAVVAHAVKKSGPALPVAAAGGPSTASRPVATTSGWSTTTTIATRELPVAPEGRMALSGPGNDSGSTLPRNADIEATRTYQVQETVERPQKGATQRKPKLAAVDNSDRRYAPEPRKKFGPWFFRQQDGSRN